MFTLIDLMSQMDQNVNMARDAERKALGLFGRPMKRMPKAPKQSKQTESKPQFEQSAVAPRCCESAAA